MNEFKDLKPGDTVFYYRNHRDTTPRQAEVIRVTPSGRVIVRIGTGEFTFNADGYERGTSGDWYRAYIELATPEKLAEIAAETERRDLVKLLDAVQWRDLPLETLRQIAALVKDGGK